MPLTTVMLDHHSAGVVVVLGSAAGLGNNRAHEHHGLDTFELRIHGLVDLGVSQPIVNHDSAPLLEFELTRWRIEEHQLLPRIFSLGWTGKPKHKNGQNN